MPAIVRSAELRWFAPGPVPGRVSTWFRSRDGHSKSKARVDNYLRVRRPGVVGVTLRVGHAYQQGTGSHLRRRG